MSARASILALGRDSAVLLSAAVALGFVANAISPRGLALRKNYFAAAESAAPRATATATVRPAASSGATSLSEARRARLEARGIAVLGFDEAARLFADPGRREGTILFVDARNAERYQAGRIPGAIPLDHYHLDRHVAEVLGRTALARRIVVYCNGGECEDSDLVASDLLELGVPADKIAVYAGGFAEWQARGREIEKSP